MAKGIYVGGWARRVTMFAMIGEKKTRIATETHVGFLFRHGSAFLDFRPRIIDDGLVTFCDAEGNHAVWSNTFCSIDSCYL